MKTYEVSILILFWLNELVNRFMFHRKVNCSSIKMSFILKKRSNVTN